MNCANCNKGFSCGCQKMIVNGITIHKTCHNEWKNKNFSSNVISNTSNDLSLELAKEQIKNLRSK
jgi:hypothetical protein